MSAVVSLVPEQVPEPAFYRVYFRRRVGRRFVDDEMVLKAEPGQALPDLLAAAPGRVVSYHRVRLHTCSACKTTALWGPGWGWYGSYGDIDLGKPIVKLCSDACWVKAKRVGILHRSASKAEVNE